MTILIITAVQKEADAVGAIDGATVIISGVGRTNAASATTQAIVEAQVQGRPVTRVISTGVAGALPLMRGEGYAATIGDVVVAQSCIYMEEGLIAPAGFQDTASMGFPLGDWPGNAVPVDADLLPRCGEIGAIAPIATVATCSGTDAAARAVAQRTGAAAEAMEGAAVLHAARRLGVPGMEVRSISNTTGDRPRQQWDLDAGLSALHVAVRKLVRLCR
jgi:futalosine hydrolase